MIDDLLFNFSSTNPASCVNTTLGCFCENHQFLSTSQPINVFTSFAFIFVGVFILLRFKRNFLSWIYSVALILIGIGTAYYHLKLTFLGQTFDFGGMNALILIAIFNYFAFNQKKDIQKKTWLAYIIILLLSFIELIYLPQFRRGTFAILIFILMGLYYWDYRKIASKQNKRYFISAFIIFAVGFLFWNFDTYHIFCNPLSWIQGHAIWHITNAFATYYLYKSICYKK